MKAGFMPIRISGYFLSMSSVLLLAVPALRNSRGDPLMLGLILTGITLSLIGIGMRWHSHRLERRAKGGE